MNRVVIDLNALRHNMQVVGSMMEHQAANWSVVTKSLCGHQDTIRALHFLGARSIADSRIGNLRHASEAAPELEKWYLRLPHLSAVPEVVRHANVSLNSEMEIIEALGREALRQERSHHIVIMIELGDLREGILPGSLIKFYEAVFEVPGVEVLGIGAQVGCLAGAVPNVDQVAQLLLYRELLELKFARKLPIISAGSSNFLPLVLENKIPRGVNHYRIGEALFLGTDLVAGGTIPGFRDDVVTLEGEIAEVKEKSLIPTGEIGATTPFDSLTPITDLPNRPGQRGYRALVPLGNIDTDVAGLTPLNQQFQIAGASSDLTVVNLGEEPGGLRVGDTIAFRPNYAAFVRLMSSPYLAKEVHPPLDEFKQALPEHWKTSVPPALEEVEDVLNGNGRPDEG
jgi:predicted amino acid racemase